MFSRKKHTTVASVMRGFRQMVTDLDSIVAATILKNVALNEERAVLDEKIEVADLEIHQARGTADRLNSLLYGEPMADE